MSRSTPVAPNSLNTLRLPTRFIIDLHVKPDSNHIQKCIYSLLNEDGSIHQRRRAAEDAIPFDDKLTLVYTDLHQGQRYTLEVDDGEGGAYYLFYKVPLERLIHVDGDDEGTDEGPGDQDHPEKYEDLIFDDTIPQLDEGRRKPFGEAGQGADGYNAPEDERPATDDADVVFV